MGRKKRAKPTFVFYPRELNLFSWVDNENIHIDFVPSKILKTGTIVKNMETEEMIRLQKQISKRGGKYARETWLVLRGFGGSPTREIRPKDEVFILGFADTDPLEAGR